MVARHFYRFDPDEEPDEVTTVLRWGYSSTEKAEEGEAGMLEIVVDDPDMTLDFVGHRSWTIYEDDAEGDQLVFFGGFTQAVRIAHKGGDITQPIARVWVIEVADMNTLWNYRILTNDECERPAETDVERMQWLLTTSPEFSYFDDPASYVSTADPVDMDEADVRGQTPASVADSCAQQSGKNWWLQAIDDAMPPGDGRTTFVWYGADSIPAYDSPLSLSNDPADLDMAAVNDGSATTYPLGGNTELRRDYARQYSGAYGEYQKGSRYVRDAATAALLTPTRQRDMASPAPEVATKAKMDARLRRVLRDHATPDHVINTTIELTGNKLPHLRAGMRVSFKATHLPDYEEGRILRALSATATPTGRRAGFDTYNLALELQGPGVVAPAPGSCSTSLANTEGTTLDTPEPGAAGSMSLAVSPTYAGSTVLIPVFSATAGNPSNAIGAFTGGFTDLEYDNTTQAGVALRIGFQQGTAPATFTAGATWDTFGPGDGGLLAVHAAIPSSATSMVQDSYTTGSPGSVSLPGAPTPGNIVLMIVHAWGNNTIVGPTVPGPDTGWTTVDAVSNTATLPVPPYNGINRASLAVYARCVEEGEDGTYNVSISGGFPSSRAVYLAEMAP